MNLEEELSRHFGFSSFLPGQRRVVELLLAGQSAAAVFPTGGGKSLCYQLPAQLLSGLTLVISPLLSLMKDQLDFLQAKNIAAAVLDSTLDRQQYNATLDRARSGALKILMVSVERFKNERFRMNLKRMEVTLIVVDEAHCISEWGHNFRPEYLKIPLYRKTFAMKQVLLLTATATPRVLADMCEKFDIPADNAVTTGFHRPNLFLNVRPTAESEKDGILNELIREDPSRPTIVYVTRQKTAERIAELLQEFSARAYHAGMKTEDRKIVQERFMAGEIPIVAATIAFGMGIDKADISTVIHLDVPYSPEAYLQETGRAGRDGKPVEATLLYSPEDLEFADSFGTQGLPGSDARAEHAARLVAERYAQMLCYATDAGCCRRKKLLGFLGSEPASCSGCDVCDGRVVDIPEGQRSILEVVSRLRRRFTLHQTVQLLRGAKSYEVVRAGLASYPGFGSLTGWKEEEIEEALDSLVKAGKMKVLKRGFWKHRVTTGEAFHLTPRS